jgi:hypothetical protein
LFFVSDHWHKEGAMEPELEIAEADGSCGKTKRDGQRCQAMAMEGSRYCFFHNPAMQKSRKAAQRRGGQAKGPVVLPAEAADLPLHSGKDVAVFLAETINQVRKGRLSPKIASTIGYLTGLLRKALETSDIEERLARVEQTLKTRRPDESLFNPDEDEVVANGNGSTQQAN